jgi:flagellar motor switch protein FliG
LLFLKNNSGGIMGAKGGIKEAAKLLAGLDAKGRKGVLDKIAHKDPRMAEALAKSMVSLEDLKFLSVGMLQDLMKEIDREDLGRALRSASVELRNFFLKSVSSTMAKDIERVLLGPPISVNRIEESSEKIMKVVRDKIDKGLIVLKKDSKGEEYI